MLNDLANRALRAGIQVMGEPVTYSRGAQSWSIRAMYQDAYIGADPETGGPVSTVQPVAGIDDLDRGDVLIVVRVLFASQRRDVGAVLERTHGRMLEVEKQLFLAALVGDLRGLLGYQFTVSENLNGDGRPAGALAGNLHFELGLPTDRDAA